jgi:hypothetical protein
MNKNIIYSFLSLVLIITCIMLSIYNDSKASFSSNTNSKLKDFASYISSSTITIMIFTCSIMSMVYQITDNLNLTIKTSNYSDDDNSDDNNSDDDCEDGNCDDD